MSRRKKILIIDRNDYHYELLCQLLSKGPINPKLTRVPDTKRGAALLKKHSYDLILTENGHNKGKEEWLNPLKENARGSPIVVLTSSGDEKKAIAAMKMGADDYIIKNRDTLKNLNQCLLGVLQRKRKKEPLGGINLLAKNLRTLTDFINHPSKGITEGKKQIKRLEREVEKLKGMMKNFMTAR